jgi:hypothetical protein
MLLCLLVNTLWLNSSLAGFGECIVDPDASQLQAQWKHYQDLKIKRAKINLKTLVRDIRMDSDTMKLIQAVSEIEPLMNLMDEVESKYLKKAFVDKRFNSMVSDPDFIEKLGRKEVDAEIAGSDLKFKNDPAFFVLLDQIRNETQKTEVKEALDLFRTLDLGILEAEYRKSAKTALRLIRKKGITQETVRNWIEDPPFLRNVFYPSVKYGPFAVRYRGLLQRSIANFVLNHEVSIEDARKLYPRIKEAEIEEINHNEPPTEKNAFDEHILNYALKHPESAQSENLSSSDYAAIDGVARTLWGEASSCQLQGLAQFEAIGRIIGDRSMAVCRAIEEEDTVKKKGAEVKEKNWAKFLKNWIGISRPAPGMQAAPSNPYHGLSDFGRKEKLDIPCAAQVVSKKNQFSVWNSYSVKRFHTGQFHSNIPDAVYEIQGPQGENDDKALVRILCPRFQTEEQKTAWKHAEEMARAIVTDPANLSSRMTWPVKGNILFYTHEAGLPFAKEVKVPHFLIDGKKAILRKGSRGSCNGFRLFVPKNRNRY